MTGQELRDFRKTNKWTQKELGRKLGNYSQVTVMSWESSKRKIPGAVIKLIKIMEQL